jgi:hypothetical protein
MSQRAGPLVLFPLRRNDDGRARAGALRRSAVRPPCGRMGQKGYAQPRHVLSQIGENPAARPVKI